MSNYHGQMMNIQAVGDGSGMNDTLSYKTGHRDARHAAAEIALGADQEIEALKQENHLLRANIAMAAAIEGRG